MSHHRERWEPKERDKFQRLWGHLSELNGKKFRLAIKNPDAPMNHQPHREGGGVDLSQAYPRQASRLRAFYPTRVTGYCLWMLPMDDAVFDRIIHRVYRIELRRGPLRETLGCLKRLCAENVIPLDP